jgi:polyhydroxyalkanoate synthesis regulator phasin
MVATEYRAGAVEEAVVTDDVAIDRRSPMDWGAIFAGAVIGATASVILLSFGTAVGLTTTSPLRGEWGLGLTGLAIATAIWVVVSQVLSFGAGGYLAGRMRRRGAVTAREAEIRDTAHGLSAWAVSALATILITALLAAGASFKTADVATGVTQGAGAAAGGAAAGAAAGDRDRQQGSLIAYYADQLFRADQAVPPAEIEAARAEAARILARGAAQGGVSSEDRDYLARVVAARGDLSEADARARVDQVLRRASEAQQQAEDTARNAAEAARKSAIVLGFLSAAALLAGAAAAGFGARCGGRDRDQGTAYRYLIRS